MSRSERRKSSRKRENGSILVTVLASLFVVVSGVFSIWLYNSAKNITAVDKVSLCPLRGSPSSIDIVLVDISDPLPETSKIEAELLLTEIAEAVPKHGLLDIRQLETTAPFQTVLFSKCRPERGSEVDDNLGNPVMEEKKWREIFFEPATKAIRQSLSPSKSDSSPIMAAIQRIAIDRFLPSSYQSVPKRFVIVSDMFESTPLYSQYNKMFDFEKFVKTPAFKTYQTDLRGASVVVFYVTRRFDYNDRAHVSFWEQWFTVNRGQIDSIKKLQGAGK